MFFFVDKEDGKSHSLVNSLNPGYRETNSLVEKLEPRFPFSGPRMGVS